MLATNFLWIFCLPETGEIWEANVIRLEACGLFVLPIIISVAGLARYLYQGTLATYALFKVRNNNY